MNLEEFFMHENQRYPPSISEHGHLYTGSKSDLLDCLESLSPKVQKKTKCNSIIVDGMVMMNMLKPAKPLLNPEKSTSNKTFKDWVTNSGIPYLKGLLEEAT